MPAPLQATYSVAATTAFANAFRTLLDAGAGAAYLSVRSAADVELARVTLTDPCGTVSGTTGVLTLTPAAASTVLLPGTAAYALLCDSAGVVQLALPAVAGLVAVTGWVVLNSLVLLAGAPVAALGVVVG